MLVRADVNLWFRTIVRYDSPEEYLTISDYLDSIRGRVHLMKNPNVKNVAIADFYDRGDRDAFLSKFSVKEKVQED